MSQNTMMIPSRESGSQQMVAPVASSSLMHATTMSVQENRDNPESRHRSSKTGEMFAIGFAIREELFCMPAIEAAVLRPNGLELTLQRIKNAFYGQWGVEASSYESQHIVASQEVQRLEEEQSRLAELQKQTPLYRTIDGRVLPTGMARWGWWGLALALVILNALAITNTAAYFRFQAQGWFVAILMAAPLLFVSMPVKFIVGKLNESARIRVGWSLASLGFVSFALFVFTIATRADPPSTADILNGTACMGSGLIPWQLASQILLEFVIATALWYWLLELMATNSRMIVNPDAVLLSSRMAALHSAMDSARSRLAVAQGNLQELRGSLDYWLQQAEIIFNTYLERHQRLEARVAALNNWPNL